MVTQFLPLFVVSDIYVTITPNSIESIITTESYSLRAGFYVAPPFSFLLKDMRGSGVRNNGWVTFGVNSEAKFTAYRLGTINQPFSLKLVILGELGSFTFFVFLFHHGPNGIRLRICCYVPEFLALRDVFPCRILIEV